MILVVSHAADEHGAKVLRALARLGHPAVLVDTGMFPQELAVEQQFRDGKSTFCLSIDGRTIDLSVCRAGWWRRPQPYTLHPAMAADSASFSYAECHEAMAGMWTALEMSWVNPPHLDELAHHKPYQLAVAAQVGFPVPNTLISNDPVAVRRFIEEIGQGSVVYKTFRATEHSWRETRILQPDEIPLLETVRHAPLIFQQFVPAVEDLRVTVVGGTILAAAIRAAPGGYQIDYRMDLPGASFEPTRLQPETETRVNALMERLGLLYGAIDLRRTAGGEEVFLEVNPAGEWLFVEDRTGQPVSEAMARMLMALDTR